MARYIAVRNLPPDDGSTVAFAAGHQVPADIAEREGWITAGLVTEVPDDEISDRLDLVEPLPDTTPDTVTPTQRLLREDFDDQSDDDGEVVAFVDAPDEPDDTAPAVGDTNPTQPATEA